MRIEEAYGLSKAEKARGKYKKRLEELAAARESETNPTIRKSNEKEFEMIKQALERNRGKRKLAAKELGISERTLYRKIKQFDL